MNGFFNFESFLVFMKHLFSTIAANDLNHVYGQISNLFILFLINYTMAEVQIVPLVSWSVISVVLFVIVGIAYRTYMRKKRDTANLDST